jgi:uncharacterized RDD family membrane protein YckC
MTGASLPHSESVWQALLLLEEVCRLTTGTRPLLLEAAEARSTPCTVSASRAGICFAGARRHRCSSRRRRTPASPCYHDRRFVMAEEQQDSGLDRETAEPLSPRSSHGLRDATLHAPEFGELEAVALPRCSQCGVTVPPDHAVLILGSQVCARCKPVFVHRLKEGAQPFGTPRWGGFWVRAGARIIDGVILWFVNVVLTLIAAIPVGALAATQEGFEPQPALFFLFYIVLYAIQIASSAAYEICFVARWAATPGKMMLGLKVLGSDGSALGWARSTARFFANMLTGFTFGIGYVLAAFDAEKRALHDMICATRVVRVR